MDGLCHLRGDDPPSTPRAERAPRPIAFAELAGAEDEFFARYFGRAPLYRPDALRQDPRRLVSIAGLDELLHLEAIRPPYLRAMRDGVMVPHLGFSRSHRVQGADVTDVVIPERVYELLRDGATLTWPALNHHRPIVRALTQMLAGKFAAETNATAFLAPAGSRALDPQHTFFDMFVIQSEGASSWKLWPRPASCRGDARHYRVAELGEPDIVHRTGPGDVLYLPWGTPHVATPETPLSLHLSVMVRVRLWSDLLRQTTRLLLTEPGYHHAPRPDPGSGIAEAFAGQIRELAASLRGTEPDVELLRLIGVGRGSLGSQRGSGFAELAGRL